MSLLIISIPLVLAQGNPSLNTESIAKDLFKRPISVSRSSNNFTAKISLNRSTNTYVSPEINQAGRTAELIFNLSQSD